MIVDEPELHLDPRAQAEVAHWLSDIHNEDGVSVLVASHSPVILGLTPNDALLVGVTRQGGVTATSAFDDGLLRSLDDGPERLGLHPRDMIQVLRGVIAVEGKHDVLVLEHFYGAELARRRLRVIALEGAPNAVPVVKHGLLSWAGIPIIVILDNIRATRVQQSDPYTCRVGTRLSREEGLANQLIELRSLKYDVKVAGYEDPDVICALPEAAIFRAFGDSGLRFTTWRAMIDRFDLKARRRRFKDFALEHMGVPTNATRFVTDVLAQVLPSEQPSSSYRRVVEEALTGTEYDRSAAQRKERDPGFA